MLAKYFPLFTSCIVFLGCLRCVLVSVKKNRLHGASETRPPVVTCLGLRGRWPKPMQDIRCPRHSTSNASMGVNSKQDQAVDRRGRHGQESGPDEKWFSSFFANSLKVTLFRMSSWSVSYSGSGAGSAGYHSVKPT